MSMTRTLVGLSSNSKAEKRFLENLINYETFNLEDLQLKLIEFYIQHANSLSFEALIKNYLLSFGLTLDLIDSNLIKINVNSSQVIDIKLDNDLAVFKQWIYINKTFNLKIPPELGLNLTECFRSDGKKLAFNQYWIQPVDLVYYTINLIDYIQLNADISYNCYFNYSLLNTTTTLAPTTASSQTTSASDLTSVNLKISFNLTYTADFNNLTSSKSLQFISDYTTFLNESFVRSNITNLLSIKVNSLKQGSVVVESTLVFKSASISTSNTSNSSNNLVANIYNSIISNSNSSVLPINLNSVTISTGIITFI